MVLILVTHLHVAKFVSIRTSLSFGVALDFKIYQMDIKCALSNGELNKDIYMTQSDGYETTGQKHLIYKLKKTMYGLKQAQKVWNEKINGFFKKLVFSSVNQIIAFMFRRTCMLMTYLSLAQRCEW
jgi:hypothetical protein